MPSASHKQSGPGWSGSRRRGAEFATRLSSAALTVGSPRLSVTPGGSNFAVEVTPLPVCPWCGSAVLLWFGQPPPTARPNPVACCPRVSSDTSRDRPPRKAEPDRSR